MVASQAEGVPVSDAVTLVPAFDVAGSVASSFLDSASVAASRASL